MYEIIDRAALLIIDMQHDFIDSDAPVFCAGAREIIPRINLLAETARQVGVPVIYTQEIHRPTHIDFGRELDGAEPIHCVQGSHGADIVPELAPQPGDTLVRKPRYSAFCYTDLPLVLAGLGIHPGDTLIITGVASDVCVHYTSADAHQADYRVRLVADCVAGTSDEAHEAALRAVKYLQAYSLTSSPQMLAALQAYQGHRARLREQAAG